MRRFPGADNGIRPLVFCFFFVPLALLRARELLFTGVYARLFLSVCVYSAASRLPLTPLAALRFLLIERLAPALALYVYSSLAAGV